MLPSAYAEIEAAALRGQPWLQTHSVADEANVVDRERLEAALEKIRSRVRDPEAGLFGPGSMILKVYGDLVTNIAGPRALMLQTAPASGPTIEAIGTRRTNNTGSSGSMRPASTAASASTKPRSVPSSARSASS